MSVVRPDFVCISFYKMFGFPTGIGALTYGQDRVTDRGGALRVLKPTPKILQLLTITRLAAKLGVYDDEQVALDSFSS